MHVYLASKGHNYINRVHLNADAYIFHNIAIANAHTHMYKIYICKESVSDEYGFCL